MKNDELWMFGGIIEFYHKTSLIVYKNGRRLGGEGVKCWKKEIERIIASTPTPHELL